MITKIQKRASIIQHNKLEKAYQKMQALIAALNKKDIPEDISKKINQEIEGINRSTETDKKLVQAINKSYKAILKIVRKKLGLLPKHHQRNIWLTIGSSTFSGALAPILSADGQLAPIILGVVVALVLPVGFVIGTLSDKKTAKEGKQLDV